MLFVRRLRLVDSAEESGQWLARANVLWETRSPLAVRIYTTEGSSLGSTIPKTLRHYADSPSWWGFSWVEQGEGEEGPTSIAATTHPAAPLQATPPTSAEAPAHIAEPTSAIATESQRSTPASDDVEGEGDVPTQGQGGAPDHESSSDAAEPEVPAAPAAEEHSESGSESEARHEPEVLSAGAAPVHSHSASSASGGDEDDFNPPEQRRHDSRGTPPARASPSATEEAACERTPTMASQQCVPIDISGAVSEGGLVVVEVFSLNTGRVVATLPVDVSAAFRVEASDVQHYALLVTPTAAEAMDATTIHGVLELTVAHTDYTLAQSGALAPREGGRADSPQEERDVDALVAAFGNDPLPVVPIASGAIACSTTQLFFPSGLLRTSGAFLVSNVVAIESTADAPVTVEMVTSGGGDSCLDIAPTQSLMLARRGERGYFVATWKFVKPFAPSVHVHLLVRVGGENYPSVDLEVHGEPPRPGNQNPPYCFWVNTTPVRNVSCSQGETALMQSVLPVYKMLELLTAGATDSTK